MDWHRMAEEEGVVGLEPKTILGIYRLSTVERVNGQ